MRGCQAPWPPEGTGQPETNDSVSQQDEQPNTTKKEVIVDYNQDIDCEGSGPKNEPVAQDWKEQNSDAECANMEIP